MPSLEDLRAIKEVDSSMDYRFDDNEMWLYR